MQASCRSLPSGNLIEQVLHGRGVEATLSRHLPASKTSSIALKCNSVPRSLNMGSSGHNYLFEVKKTAPICSTWYARRRKAGDLIVVSGTLTRDSTAEPVVAELGDMVGVHFRCVTQDGEVLEASDRGSPLTFEVGAGNVMGNPLFQGFDSAVQGLSVGESRTVQAVAGDRDEELVFRVPLEHEEMQRLRAEAEAPLRAGSYVMLSNGNPAVILEVNEETVVLDANHPLAGTLINFEVEVATIQKLTAISE